jgi:hypothetical protein
MNLRETAAKALLQETEIPALEEAWRNMWHNASFSQPDGWYLPDFASDQERDSFDCWLEIEAGLALHFLEEDIAEQFCIDMKLYTYGRSGATVAPDAGKYAAYCLRYGVYSRHFDLAAILEWGEFEDLEEAGEPEWSEALEFVTAHRKAFEYINDCVRGFIRAIPDAWAKTWGRRRVEDKKGLRAA